MSTQLICAPASRPAGLQVEPAYRRGFTLGEIARRRFIEARLLGTSVNLVDLIKQVREDPVSHLAIAGFSDALSGRSLR